MLFNMTIVGAAASMSFDCSCWCEDEQGAREPQMRAWVEVLAERSVWKVCSFGALNFKVAGAVRLPRIGEVVLNGSSWLRAYE